VEEPILNSHNKLEYEPAHTCEHMVNEVISSNLDVTIRFVSREEAAKIVDLSKLPEDA